MRLDPTVSISSATDPDALCFFWPVQASDVFGVRLPLLSFCRFQGLAHAVKDAVRISAVAALDVTLVLVVVVNVIFLADDEVLFHRAPALTPTAAFPVVSLFLSWLFGFIAGFCLSVSFSKIAS